MCLAFKQGTGKWGEKETAGRIASSLLYQRDQRTTANKGRSQRKQGVRAKLLLQGRTAIPAVADIENSLSTLLHTP